MKDETCNDEHYFRINNLFEREVNVTADDTPRHTIKLGGLGSITRLDKNIIAVFEKCIGLLFVGKMEDGNVCFANNNDDLRDEFKQVFYPGDVLDYVYGALNAGDETARMANPKIPYPENADEFWRLASSGKTIRAI